MRRQKTSNHGRFSKKQKKASRSMMLYRRNPQASRNAAEVSSAIRQGFSLGSAAAMVLPVLAGLMRRGRGR